MADELITGMTAGSEVSPGQLTLFDDLNAVRMHMYGSMLGPKSYILQRWREGFERPTFLVQSLNQSIIPKNAYWAQVDHNMLVEFYALDYESAMRVSGDLLLLFGTPGNGLVLPYWDMDQDPPAIQYDNHWQQWGFPADSVPRMGVRVLQDTITVTNEQEEMDVADRQDYTVSMTFRALAPRVLYDVTQEQPILEAKISGFVAA